MGVYIELPKEWAKWSFDVRDVHDNVLDAWTVFKSVFKDEEL